MTYLDLPPNVVEALLNGLHVAHLAVQPLFLYPHDPLPQELMTRFDLNYEALTAYTHHTSEADLRHPGRLAPARPPGTWRKAFGAAAKVPDAVSREHVRLCGHLQNLGQRLQAHFAATHPGWRAAEVGVSSGHACLSLTDFTSTYPAALV